VRKRRTARVTSEPPACATRYTTSPNTGSRPWIPRSFGGDRGFCRLCVRSSQKLPGVISSSKWPHHVALRGEKVRDRTPAAQNITSLFAYRRRRSRTACDIATVLLLQLGRRGGVCRALRWEAVADEQPAVVLKTSGVTRARLFRTNPVQNVRSCRRTGPIDGQRSSVRFGLKARGTKVPMCELVTTT
jgi:hypothetical protein